MMTLDDMVRLAEEHARRILIRTKEQLLPSWLIATGEEVLIVGTPWNGDDEKHDIVTVMRAMMRDKQAHAYSLLVEAWFAVERRRPGEKPPELADYEGPRPSERPDRREAVMITAENIYGETRHRSLEIIRDKKGRCIELKRRDGPEDVITTIFDGLLDKKETRQ